MIGSADRQDGLGVSAALTLLAATVAINILGLALPVAAQQIFSRVIREPQTGTLQVLIVLVLTCALAEAGLRFGRAHIMSTVDRHFMTRRFHWLCDRVVRRQAFHSASPAAASLELATSLTKTKDRVNGQLMVAKAELLFAPLIVGLIYYISWICGVAVTLIVIASAIFTYVDARRLPDCSEANFRTTERRYEFLFSVFSSVRSVKGLGVERGMARGYERLQAEVARANTATADLIGRIMNQAQLANQVLTASLLVVCAILVTEGMTLGAASAIILLAGRLVEPTQRAVFIFVQARDLRKAEETMAEFSDGEVDPVCEPVVLTGARGDLVLDGVSIDSGLMAEPVARPISLSTEAGHTIAIAPGNERLATSLLRTMAGILQPKSGLVTIDGHNIAELCPSDRNRLVSYLSPDARLFDGTIRDNITRFGEVSLAQAMAVARLLDMESRFNELPRGVETVVGGPGEEVIAPGAQQQIALLRALVLRPRVILFDNADRGLDREAYARLVKFFARIRHGATIVLATDDANLAALADATYGLDEQGLTLRDDFVATTRAYSTLKI
ncbi:ATP-binding cassette domain-containing protein [Brevundimonas sp. R86498]|uniref:ATP-binding cassette domain-containing protein n=1 Tax=Brevundimonas sp. R86498 TaxID=3093845 RepID=UPI0037C6345E